MYSKAKLVENTITAEQNKYHDQQPIEYAKALTAIGWLECVENLGLDADNLLAQVDLHREVLFDPENLLPYRSFVHLVNLSARESGIEHFGLEVTKHWPHASQIDGALGFLTQLMMHSSSIGEAWQYFCEHYHLHSQGIAWTLKHDLKYAYIQRESLLPSDFATFQTASINLAHIFKTMRHLLEDDSWAPAFVSFSHQAPSEPAVFQRYFSCPTHFAQEFCGIAFPVQQLKKKISYTNDKLQVLLKGQLNKFGQQSQVSGCLTSRIEMLIRQGIRNSDCNQANIAQLMQMHPKKLQRELKAQGLCFRNLKAKIRLDLAEHFIKDSKMPLTAIAEMLGYSALSALSRSFKSRHGIAPQEWRS